MFHIKFQASEPSSSEEEDFLNIFPCISKVRIWDPLAQDHPEPCGLDLDKLGKRPPGTAEEDDFKIFCFVFLRFEPRIFFWGVILDPGSSIRTNLVKDHQVMLHTKFQASEQSGSQEEDFFFYLFYVFLWFETRTLWPRANLVPGTFV